VRPTERIRELLDPAYSSRLSERTTEVLREMKDECAGYEHAVSFYRRLAQGRLEILDAERDRRARGGSVEELIADLPRILSGGVGGSRPDAVNARFTDPEVPEVSLHFPGGEEELIADDTLAQLPNLDDAQLAEAVEALRSLEQQLSDTRHGLHRVIDAIEHELAERQAAGTVG
jgi:hypothetical protein